jgi:transglycosylase-like protein with SLT domain
MILSLLKRYIWVLCIIFGGLLLHAIVSHVSEDEKDFQTLPSREKSSFQFSSPGGVKSLHSREAYDVIVEKNIFKRKTSQAANDFLSTDFSKIKPNLILLGTVRGKRSSSAIIKNPATGAVKTYTEGDRISLTNSEEIKLVRVSECMAMVRGENRYETLNCTMKGDSPSRSYPQASGVANYKVRVQQNMSKPNYEEEILKASRKHGIDPDLVRAVIKVESDFNPNAISPKNAMGIMQLMPDTARDYSIFDPFDPKENIDGGVRALRDLMDYFNNDLSLSLAAYNAGKEAVIKYGFRVPPYAETIDYVSNVFGRYVLIKWNNYNRNKAHNDE